MLFSEVDGLIFCGEGLTSKHSKVMLNFFCNNVKGITISGIVAKSGDGMWRLCVDDLTRLNDGGCK